MLILTLRTDNPEAEVGLWDGQQKLAGISWPAHRQLSATIHQKISQMLTETGQKWEDIQAVNCYQGPGSFTGLRIGISVANALADSYNLPITGSTGNQWRAEGNQKLLNGDNQHTILPLYGADVHITPPRGFA